MTSGEGCDRAGKKQQKAFPNHRAAKGSPPHSIEPQDQPSEKGIKTIVSMNKPGSASTETVFG